MISSCTSWKNSGKLTDAISLDDRIESRRRCLATSPACDVISSARMAPWRRLNSMTPKRRRRKARSLSAGCRATTDLPSASVGRYKLDSRVRHTATPPWSVSSAIQCQNVSEWVESYIQTTNGKSLHIMSTGVQSTFIKDRGGEISSPFPSFSSLPTFQLKGEQNPENNMA